MRPGTIISAAGLGALLAAVFAMLWPAAQAREPVAAPHAGANACRLCHNTSADGKRFDTWRNSRHSRAFATLMSEESREIAKARNLAVPAHEAPECLRCHVTGYDAPARRAPDRLPLVLGVQCETCHGPGETHVLDAREVKMRGAKIDLSAHIGVPGEADCASCHNPESPTWNPNRYTLEDGTGSGFDYRQARERAVHPEARQW